MASDECYAELGWGRWESERIPSVLDPRVCEGNYENLLALYSLSKQSNLAGYRAAFAAGVRDFGEKDLKLFDGIVGFMVEQKIVPTPVPYRDGLQFGFYKE